MPPELPHNRTRIRRPPSASIAIRHGGAIVSAPRVPEARGWGFVTPPLHHHVISVAVIPSARPIAIMPPVDVPEIRSKYRPMGCSRSCSRLARKAAGKVPRIPPPSTVRILFNECAS